MPLVLNLCFDLSRELHATRSKHFDSVVVVGVVGSRDHNAHSMATRSFSGHKGGRNHPQSFNGYPALNQPLRERFDKCRS